MAYFNIVAQSSESTVATEYKPQAKRSEAYQSEAELEKEFPGYPEIIVNELSLSVACHIGDGALAVACSRIPEV